MGNSNGRQAQTSSLDVLPEDLLREILYRLSPKTLLICTAVRKSWGYLVHNPSFIYAHLSRRLQNPENPLFLFRNDRASSPETYSFASDFSTPHFTRLSPIHVPVLAFDSLRRTAVTSCSGLVCVSDADGYSLILWNPSINKWEVVPFPVEQEESPEIFGLGFDSRANDFKVLMVLGSGIDFWVYSLNSDSWVDISHLAPLGLSHYYYEEGIVLSGNGFLNFIGGVERRVRDDDGVLVKQFVNCTLVGFDCSANVFHPIPFPACLRELALKDVKLSMMVFGEPSVALVCGFVRRGLYDVWGLGVYGDANSWIRLFRIRDTVHEIRGWMFRKPDELLLERMDEVHNVNEEGEDADIVLGGSGRGIVVCDPETRQVNYLVNWPSEGCSYVGPFVDSLVLLDAQE